MSISPDTRTRAVRRAPATVTRRTRAARRSGTVHPPTALMGAHGEDRKVGSAEGSGCVIWGRPGHGGELLPFRMALPGRKRAALGGATR
ncbi:hypothetical protein GCM10010394_22240 [Streptomyces crystallinus]|uniref:Uncharacterized protein n=1 Tax=Streptomyces crystallinus TaxID=68191 RepID=A0ABN1FKM1_9ACTN